VERVVSVEALEVLSKGGVGFDGARHGLTFSGE
jgi:hypothetical protein